MSHQRQAKPALRPPPLGVGVAPGAGDTSVAAASAGDAARHPAATGQALALDDLFRRYAPYVAKIGYRLLGRDDEVDDLVQDVFLSAHRGLRGLRDAEAVRGWLATVAVRTAQRRLRRRRVLGFLHLDSQPAYEELVAPGASPEQQAMLGSVYRLLDKLPANQRIPWALRYVEGEQLDRIATLCRCSLATAKRRIKAAQDVIQGEIGHA